MNQNIKRVLAFVVCLTVITTLFAACSKNNVLDGPGMVNKTGDTAEWVITPNIEAEAIEPLVRADFNESTNHYDISYADCFRIKQNGKYGIIDLNGKIVIKPQFDELFAIRGSMDFLGVKINSKGERSQKYIHYGTFKTENAYKKYNSEKYEYYWNTRLTNLVPVKIKGNKTEEVKMKPMVPEVVTGVVKNDGKFVPDGKYGLYANSQNVMGMVYSGAGQFSDGKVAFKSGDKWGYIDSNGRTAIPFRYDAVPGYSVFGGEDTPYESYSGFVTLYKDGKFGILNDEGKEVAQFVYDGATPVVNGQAFVNTDGKWGVILVGEVPVVSETTTAEATEAATSVTEKTTEKTKTERTTEKTTETTDEDEEESTTRKSEYSKGSYHVSGEVNVRRTSNTNSDNVIGSIGEGEKIYVDSVDGVWGHVSYDGYDGWVYLGLCEKD